MKTLLYALIIIYVMCQPSVLIAQNQQTIDFGDAFCVQYDEDDTRNYYAVNLNLFEDETLQKSFIKKVYYDSHLAAMSSPDATGMWLLTAHKVYEKEKIIGRLQLFRDEILQSREPVAIENGTE